MPSDRIRVVKPGEDHIVALLEDVLGQKVLGQPGRRERTRQPQAGARGVRLQRASCCAFAEDRRFPRERIPRIE